MLTASHNPPFHMLARTYNSCTAPLHCMFPPCDTCLGDNQVRVHRCVRRDTAWCMHVLHAPYSHACTSACLGSTRPDSVFARPWQQQCFTQTCSWGEYPDPCQLSTKDKPQPPSPVVVAHSPPRCLKSIRMAGSFTVAGSLDATLTSLFESVAKLMFAPYAKW